MKVLLLILMIFTVFNCGETPDEKNKKKNFNATIFLAIADYMRTQDPDDQEAAENAAAIAAARALPLYDISSASLTEIQNLNLNGVVVSVNMTTGTPVVTFYITNTTNRLKGFGWTTKTSGKFNTTTGVSSATATDFITNLTSASNLQFTFAKFVPGLNGSPDKWISYLTTSVPTPNGINGTGTTAVQRTWGWSKNTTDTTGNLVDNGDGTYTYTFARDITKSKDYIASEYLSTGNQVTAGLTAVSAFKQSGTGNLTYDPNLPHRIAILIGSGSVRGTSTNNSNGTNQPVISGGSAVAALNFNRGKTITYDFIPSTNKIKARQRDIVSVNTCNNCHKDVTATTTSGITTRGLIFHGAGGRNDVTQCVTCHTDQTKAQSTTGGDQVSSSYSFGATGNGFLLDGESVVDFPVMVHKFHMSSNLIKSGAGYYPASSSYPFPTKAAAFITKASSQLCYNCHTTNKTARNEDNWKTRPSKIACGACHDGLNFSSGLLTSVNRSNLMPTHGGGAQVDDSKCAGCHTTSNIISKHGL